MKLLVDALNSQGFYGRFSGDRGCVVDRTNEIVLIVQTRIESNAARTDLAQAVADALNAQIAAQARREAA